MGVQDTAGYNEDPRAMGTRTVRLDAAGETALADLRRRTGMSISEIMREGLRAYAKELDDDITRRPGEVYRSLGLSRTGGYAIAPAESAKEVIAEVIRKRHEQ